MYPSQGCLQVQPWSTVQSLPYPGPARPGLASSRKPLTSLTPDQSTDSPVRPRQQPRKAGFQGLRLLLSSPSTCPCPELQNQGPQTGGSVTLWKGHPICRGGPHCLWRVWTLGLGTRRDSWSTCLPPQCSEKRCGPVTLVGKGPKNPTLSPPQNNPSRLSCHTPGILVAPSPVISKNGDGLKSKGQINLHHHRRDPRALPQPLPIPCGLS